MSTTICSHPDFLSAWVSSLSIAEVAEKTGLQEESCRKRAWRLRRSGKALKHMGGTRYASEAHGGYGLQPGEKVRALGKSGTVAMVETDRAVIQWTDGTTSTATRRGAIYVERIG